MGFQPGIALRWLLNAGSYWGAGSVTCAWQAVLAFRAHLGMAPPALFASVPSAASGSVTVIETTAYPFCPLPDYVERFMRLDIKPEARERILWRNADALLKLGLDGG